MRLSCSDSFCLGKLFQSATRICWPVTNFYCWIEMEASLTRHIMESSMVTLIETGTRFIMRIVTISFIIAYSFSTFLVVVAASAVGICVVGNCVVDSSLHILSSFY